MEIQQVTHQCRQQTFLYVLSKYFVAGHECAAIVRAKNTANDTIDDLFI